MNWLDLGLVINLILRILLLILMQLLMSLQEQYNQSSTSPNSQLLMPTMSDLNEVTCRRRSRVRKSPEYFDPSAASTIQPDPPKAKCGLFTMLCLVTVSTLVSPSIRSSIFKALFITPN